MSDESTPRSISSKNRDTVASRRSEPVEGEELSVADLQKVLQEQLLECQLDVIAGLERRRRAVLEYRECEAWIQLLSDLWHGISPAEWIILHRRQHPTPAYLRDPAKWEEFIWNATE